MWQRGPDDLDPLDATTRMERARALDPRLTQLHPDMAKQAVVNAARAAVLGDRASRMTKAQHYQALQGVPAGVDDPEVFRQVLDQTHGEIPAYWAEEQQFKQWVKALNPDLNDEQVAREAKRELGHMLVEEEQRVLSEDVGHKLTAEDIQLKVQQALQRRLKVLTRTNTSEDTDLPRMARTAASPYLSTTLRSLAHVGRHADELHQAAQEDLHQHKGHGHHFRSTALQLDIPGFGARQASEAWHHLAPQTSQLAVISPEVTQVLGHEFDNDNRRDFFRHERELSAARDAAGYGHLPLGVFSTAVHDLATGGPGYHADRTAFKPHLPRPATEVDWTNEPEGVNWQEPYWWASTLEPRERVAQDFDRNVAVTTPTSQIPYKLASNAAASWVTHPQTGERITGASGTSLMAHIKRTFGHPSCQDVWNQDYEAGKRAPTKGRVGTVTKVAAEPNITFLDQIDPYMEDAESIRVGQPCGYWGRWPTLYDPATGTTYVGTEGSAHYQIKNALGIDYGLDHGYDDRVHEGWIGPNPEKDTGANPVERQFNVGPVGWYNNSPSPTIDYALGTREWPSHPDSNVEAPNQGYGHADRLRGSGTVAKVAEYATPQDAAYWNSGACGEYAKALKDLHPELQYGFHYDPAEADDTWDADDPEERKLYIGSGWQHAFVHNDTHAFDVTGAHPLPYQGDGIKTTWQGVYGLQEPDMVDYNIFDTYFEPDNVELAHQFIADHGDPVTRGTVAKVASDEDAPYPATAEQLPEMGPYGGSEQAAGQNWLGAGGCAHLALAYKNIWPEMKIAAEWSREGYNGDVDGMSHAVAYDPQTGMGHDVFGSAPVKYKLPSFGGQVTWDQDPQELADYMGIDWDPENKPWGGNGPSMDGFSNASEFIDQHHLGRPAPTWDDEDRGTVAKVAAATRNQLLQQAAGLPEDQSQVVHQWPDGWSMRQLSTYGDMYREGTLMRNCFSPLTTPDEASHDAWAYHPGVSGDITNLDPRTVDLNQPLRQPLYSLRDSDNLPHASVDPHTEDYRGSVLGRHNSDLKAQYAARVGEWAGQNEHLLSDPLLVDHLQDPDNFT